LIARRQLDSRELIHEGIVPVCKPVKPTLRLFIGVKEIIAKNLLRGSFCKFLNLPEFLKVFQLLSNKQGILIRQFAV